MTTQEALTSSQFCIFKWERAEPCLPRHIVCFQDSSIALFVSAGRGTIVSDRLTIGEARDRAHLLNLSTL
jgi:hypothetical protein